MDGPDFIGLGAQKAGTSWIYACLYEHPEVCTPIKEINFFSRYKNWSRGYEWYERRYKSCSIEKIKGEFSTSYLSSYTAAQRIKERYPDVKLLVCLRNPIERAFSNYRNDIKRGNVAPDDGFWELTRERPEYIQQGRYGEHVRRYLDYFSREQLLIMIYDDMVKEPLSFIQTIYDFLGIQSTYEPSVVEERINVSRSPMYPWIDLGISSIARWLREIGLHDLVWTIKQSRIPKYIRSLNTSSRKRERIEPSPKDKKKLYDVYKKDILLLEEFIDRKLVEWKP